MSAQVHMTKLVEGKLERLIESYLKRVCVLKQEVSYI